MFKKMLKHRMLFATVLALVLVALAAGAWYWFGRKAPVAVVYKTPQEMSNIYVRFEMEAYDQIVQNYWQQVTDADMSQLFQLSVQKAANLSTTTLPAPTRAGTAAM